jgi:NADH:ubiquinone oxidoreductase subunit K
VVHLFFPHNKMSANYAVYLSAFVFCVGLATVLSKRNLIGILIGIELLFNAATINFIAFSTNDTAAEGQIVSLFVIVVATAETAIALAIAYLLYEYLKTDEITQFNQLKEEE